jgi:hypothetical protein
MRHWPMNALSFRSPGLPCNPWNPWKHMTCLDQLIHIWILGAGSSTDFFFPSSIYYFTVHGYSPL